MKQQKEIIEKESHSDKQLNRFIKNSLKNKVRTNEFNYEEEVREFTGLIFHCPNCDKVFHLHIAEVSLK